MQISAEIEMFSSGTLINKVAASVKRDGTGHNRNKWACSSQMEINKLVYYEKPREVQSLTPQLPAHCHAPPATGHGMFPESLLLWRRHVGEQAREPLCGCVVSAMGLGHTIRY